MMNVRPGSVIFCIQRSGASNDSLTFELHPSGRRPAHAVANAFALSQIDGVIGRGGVAKARNW